MRKRHLCDAKFRLKIEVKGPVLIKASEAQLSGPDMTFVKTYAYDGEAGAYLPGTSLKGVFRSHAERLVRSLAKGEHPVCLPYDFKPGSEQSCGKKLAKTEGTHEVYKQECPACKLFGSLKYKGRIFINDAYAEDIKTLKYETRDGVAIDRVTGGAAAGALYDFQVLTRGVFETDILLDNFESWQLGLISLIFDDFKDERMRLGMGTSRGLGHVKGTVISAKLRYPRTHDDKFCGIGTLSREKERKMYGLASDRKQLKLKKTDSSGIWNIYSLKDDKDDDDTKLKSVFKEAREDLFNALAR